MLEYTTRTADVYAHDKGFATLNNVNIVSGATALDYLVIGQTYIIIINEVLY